MPREKHSQNAVLRTLLSTAPGMRIIKTGLAIFICLLIDYFRQPANVTQSAIAALFCLGHNLRTTFESSVNRVIGTIFAGFFAYGFLLLSFQVFHLDKHSIWYLFIVVLFTMVLMQLLVKLKRRGGSAIAAMTFIIICLSDAAGIKSTAPLSYTLVAVSNTLLGIFAALFVDWFPPLNFLGKKLYLAKAEYAPEEQVESKFNLEEFEERSRLSSIFKDEEELHGEGHEKTCDCESVCDCAKFCEELTEKKKEDKA